MAAEDPNKPEKLALLLKELERAVGELESMLRQVTARGRFLVPDLAIIGLGREVLQQAKATLILATSDVPSAAFSTARGAFEAAQDILLVAVRLSDGYELTGARILAADLLTREKIGRDYGESLRQLGGQERSGIPIEGGISAEEALRQWGALWDHARPGSSDLIREAAEGFKARLQSRRRFPPHWSGLTRRGITKALQEHVDELAGSGGFRSFGDSQYGVFSILSSMTHPWPRFNTEFLSLRQGKIRIDITPRDPSNRPLLPGMAAAFACFTATLAMRLLLENEPNELLGRGR